MIGPVHNAEPMWVNNRPTAPVEIRMGDEILCFLHKAVRRARVSRTIKGSGKGTVWLHGASGAQIRCLWGQRVAIQSKGRRVYLPAEEVRPGDFLYRVVDEKLTVDPVIATRQTEEPVLVTIIEVPAVSLLSEEGFLWRLS